MIGSSSQIASQSGLFRHVWLNTSSLEIWTHPSIAILNSLERRDIFWERPWPEFSVLRQLCQKIFSLLMMRLRKSSSTKNIPHRTQRLSKIKRPGVTYTSQFSRMEEQLSWLQTQIQMIQNLTQRLPLPTLRLLSLSLKWNHSEILSNIHLSQLQTQRLLSYLGSAR